MLKYVSVCGEPETSKWRGRDVGGWISGRQPQPLQCHACSIHTVCLGYDIHNGTGMSQRVFACLDFMRMYMCVFVCVHSSSKFSRSVWCPQLILSQNGCCQAEKLLNGALMGLNGKVIHNCGLLGLIASNMKS